jgi:hypothetical protein
MVFLFLAVAAGTVVAADVPARDLMPVTWLKAPTHPPIELVRQGATRAVVYLADTNANVNLKRLVDELQEVVKLSTGATLPVVNIPPPDEQPAIMIGDCKESRKAGIDAAALPVEGFVVKTAASRVFLVGSTVTVPLHNKIGPFVTDGTAWAVADFLERFVGVRWYWPAAAGGRTLVKTPDLSVLPAHYRDAPVFQKREHHPLGYLLPSAIKMPSRTGTDPMMAYLRGGKGPERLDMYPFLTFLRSGNSWPCNILVHQPQKVPAMSAAWFKEHGAIAAVTEDNNPDDMMLCYSAPGTFDLLIEGARSAWDEGKDASWVSELCLSISPADAPVDCYCAECRKLWDARWGKEPTMPAGQASRVMGVFVRRVCEEVKRRWPGKKVMYLPYWNYAFCPEEMDFPDNLMVEMCTTGFPRMRQASVREEIGKALRAWSRKIGGPITTWEYSCWTPGNIQAPVQYPHVLQEYYRSNRDILAGSFLNGAIIDEWSKTVPTLYCWMRLLWNPDIDIDATLDEMCARLFGKGARSSRALMRLMCDRWEKAPWSQPLPGGDTFSPVLYHETWPPEVVAEMQRLYRQARQEMQDDPTALQRFDYWNWTFEAFLREARVQAESRSERNR